MFPSPHEFLQSYGGPPNDTNYFACYVTSSESGRRILRTSFGKWRDDIDLLRMSGNYSAARKTSFTIEGVQGSGDICMNSEGTGGTSMFVCVEGTRFITVSIPPRGEMRGDLEANMIDLTTSMVPWACEGQPIPPLGEGLGDLVWSEADHAPSPAPDK